MANEDVSSGNMNVDRRGIASLVARLVLHHLLVRLACNPAVVLALFDECQNKVNSSCTLKKKHTGVTDEKAKQQRKMKIIITSTAAVAIDWKWKPSQNPCNICHHYRQFA